VGVSEKDVELVREDLGKIRTAIAATSPFLSSMLVAARIVVSEAIDTAAVDAKLCVIINPEFWKGLSFEEKVYVVLHEVCHAAFGHPVRGKGRNWNAWAIAIDCVVNGLLMEFFPCPSLWVKGIGMITPDIVAVMIKEDVKEVKKMTAEEIYERIPKVGCKPKCPRCGSENIVVKRVVVKGLIVKGVVRCKDCGYEWEFEGTLGDGDFEIPVEEWVVEEEPPTIDVRRDEIQGTVIQEGSKEVYEEAEAVEERVERWRERVADAYMAQKLAGNVPEGLRRIVERILRAKVDWRALLWVR